MNEVIVRANLFTAFSRSSLWGCLNDTDTCPRETNGKSWRNGIGKTLDSLPARSPSLPSGGAASITLGFCRQETLIDGRNCRGKGKIKSGPLSFLRRMDFAEEKGLHKRERETLKFRPPCVAKIGEGALLPPSGPNCKGRCCCRLEAFFSFPPLPLQGTLLTCNEGVSQSEEELEGQTPNTEFQ